MHVVLEFDLTIFDGVTAHADLGQLKFFMLLYRKILPSFVLN